MSTTSTTSAWPPKTTGSRCSRHRAVATALRCDRCELPFCRECLVSRFVTSRSSVWLCRRCAGIETEARYGLPPGGRRGPLRTGGSSRGWKYWLTALGFAAFVLVTALHQGLIR
jgi:hypothetical protein